MLFLWTDVILCLTAQKCARCWPVDKGPCFQKVLIQKPNVCDISKGVCGKVGTSPWQAGSVLCFSIVRIMTEKMLFKGA